MGGREQGRAGGTAGARAAGGGGKGGRVCGRAGGRAKSGTEERGPFVDLIWNDPIPSLSLYILTMTTAKEVYSQSFRLSLIDTTSSSLFISLYHIITDSNLPENIN